MRLQHLRLPRLASIRFMTHYSALAGACLLCVYSAAGSTTSSTPLKLQKRACALHIANMAGFSCLPDSSHIVKVVVQLSACREASFSLQGKHCLGLKPFLLLEYFYLHYHELILIILENSLDRSVFSFKDLSWLNMATTPCGRNHEGEGTLLVVDQS